MKFSILVGSLLISQFFLVCGDALAASKQLIPDDAEGALLRLSGSNTIGAALAPAWSKAFLESNGVNEVSIVETEVENEYRVEGTFGGKSVFVEVNAHGSSTGFKSLKSGHTDIAMSSRPIKTSELSVLSHLGNLLSHSAEHVVAIDGVAIIVHPSNPIAYLSLSQIAEVFSGKVTNWKQLGGHDERISVFARDNASGTWDTFKGLVLQKRFRLSAKAQRFESNDKLAQRVSASKGGIGFVGLSAINNVKPLAIGSGGSSVKPSKLLVATEDYPLSRRLFLYTPERAEKPIQKAFIEFVQSHSGQVFAEQVGFVSQVPFGIAAPVSDGPVSYQVLSKFGQRLSVNFRFNPLSAQLDNKAKRDAYRLGEYLKKQNHQPFVQLVGFSQSSDNSATADILSKLRASAVKIALFSQGVYTESVAGFGSQLPVASDDIGGHRNNRVEVWVYSHEQAQKMREEHERIVKRREEPAVLVNYF